MRAIIFIAALLTVAEDVLANDLAAVEAPADTWCITYLSTYLAAVTTQVGLLPSDGSGNEKPSAQDSGRLPYAPSFRPTFGRNTSISMTRSSMSTDVQNTLGLETSFLTSDGINTAEPSLVNSESSNLDADSTAAPSSSDIVTLTDDISTVMTSTIDAEATTTSTDIIEPAGRIVIFLIQTTDNERRSIYRRANSGFIGNNNPNVCTFATTFNLAQGQLFDDGMPIYYSGEDYKELSAQGRPPGGSIISGFADSGSTLTFRNSELPNGEAGFCQDASGQVYITFTTGPSGCVPVNLAVYNVDQCQNGRLIGLDELTSSVSRTDTATAEKSLSAQSTFGEPPESTALVSSESTILTTQTSAFQGSTTRLSSVTESSTQGPGDISSQETSTLTVREDLETRSSVSTISGDSTSQSTAAFTSQSTETSDILDSTATSSDGTGVSTISDMKSQTTTEIETSHTAISDTTVIPETTETTTTQDDTSSTDIISDVDTTTSTDIMDTATANIETMTQPEDSTTTEAEPTTKEATTMAEPPTTTEAAIEPDSTTTEAGTTTAEVAPQPQQQFACGDPGYDTTYTYNGVIFYLICARDGGYSPLDFLQTASFGECLRGCAQTSECVGVFYQRSTRTCILSTYVQVGGPNSGFDLALVASRS